MRAKLSKKKQREFLVKVMQEVGSPSLFELSRRIDVNYSTMKNYFNGDRLFPKELYENLIKISGLKCRAEFVENNWGQIKGGKKGRRN